MATRHVSLLTKGPKFTPLASTRNEFESDIKDFTRKIKIKDVFHNKENADISLHRNKSNRTIHTQNSEINQICDFIELLKPEYINMRDNLTEEERVALNELSNNDNIVLKPADKSGNFIIMDKAFYRDKLVLNDHLNTENYKKVDQNEDLNVIKNLNSLLKQYEKDLTKKEVDYIKNFQWKTSNFYILPKIHKCDAIIQEIATSDRNYIEMSAPNNLKGRPIIAGPASPTHRLSQFIDTLLKPIVPTISSYVKDDWDFLGKIPKQFDNQTSLYSYDVVSLYTSIPHNLGIEAIKFWTDKRKDLIPPRFSQRFILDSVKFILQNNNFLFDNVLYQQVSGTAMGTKFAPPYACLTIGFLEETVLYPKILKNYFNDQICSYIKESYIRYMDDCFIALPQDIDPVLFLNALNNLHESIRFTMDKGTIKSSNIETLNFLDIEIILKEGKFISTDIYYKSTNPHDYLNYNSAHPKHVKDTIPFNLAKRIIIFVTEEDRISERLKELETWLLSCNYPLELIRRSFRNAKLQGPAPKPNKDIIPLVTTYYPNLKNQNIMKTISSLLNSIQDQQTKDKFKNTKPILALRQPANLKSLLTKAKFNTNNDNNNPNLSRGIFLCENQRCKLCRMYLQPVNSFLTANGTNWQIKSNITCNSTNVIYFLSCNLCEGNMNYIGQTTNLRSRINNHISESKSGISYCNFPKHVHNCGIKNHNLKEPFFKVFVFFKLKDPKMLLHHENSLFKAGHSLMNS